ncbi:MAG: AAA family ATPase [Candidatus Saccharimonadales bacterium]
MGRHAAEVRYVTNEQPVERCEYQPNDMTSLLGARALEGYTIAELPERHSKMHIEEDLKDYIVGQDHAIEAMMMALQRAEISDPTRPIANILCLGPTGVGKTETAKKLAELLGTPFTKIDCAAFSHGHEIAMLTGSPAGYVGHNKTEPIFNEELVQSRFSVVLFDEIEKGSPELHALMLSIMNDGELTMNNTGEKLSFSNTIIIMTSNVGAHEIKSLASEHQLGFSSANRVATSTDMRSVAMKALEDKFTPEFIGRLDEKIMFNQLSDEQMGEVLVNYVHDANEKRYYYSDIELQLMPEVVDYLVQSTDDRHKFGARPVVHAYSSIIETGLARRLDGGTIPEGSEVTCFLKPADEKNPEPEVVFAWKPNEFQVSPEEIDLINDDLRVQEASTGREMVKYVGDSSMSDNMAEQIGDVLKLFLYEQERIRAADNYQI